MNFQGVMENGDRPENMKGQEFVLEMGKGQFIPGFEEGMLGMKKSEKRDIDLTFPEDYQVEDLKNAKVKFEVELLEIKEKKYPELTDELVKEFGFDSVEDFETKNRYLIDDFEQFLVSFNEILSEKVKTLERLILKSYIETTINAVSNQFLTLGFLSEELKIKKKNIQEAILILISDGELKGKYDIRLFLWFIF